MAKQKKVKIKNLLIVLVLAAALPILLQTVTRITRLFVGAEGRLAAITVDTSRPLGPLPRPWAALAQGGDNLPNFLDGIENEVKNLNPKYIRIDHIYTFFDVVSRQNDRLEFDWSKLDVLINKIRATGAIPFISLSYMPQQLAVTDIISEPRNWNEWSLVVQKTIERYSGDLAIDNVYYEVWNEPDLFGGWRMGGRKDYRSLYLYASRGAALAKVKKPFKLGGPATTGLYKNWMDQFFPYVLSNNLRLDFFSWHRYDLDMDRYKQDVDSVNLWLEKHPYFYNTEKILTEFGPDSKSGGNNDTRLGAAHLVAVMRELIGRISYGFTFAVNGDFGVIGKPRYQALSLLKELGDQRLSLSGEGSWVKAIGAQKNSKSQVLLTNYDQEGIHSEMVPVTFLGLDGGKYVLTERFLGSKGRTIEIATTSAIWQHDVPMTPNSVVLLELEEK